MSDAENFPPSIGLGELRNRLRKFASDRDWDQFHTPKNLAISISIEAGELLEHFQWVSADPGQSFSSEEKSAIRKEMADVLLYLIRLSDLLNIDLLESALEKLEENAQKYPVEKAKGTSKKYTDL